MNNTVHNSIQSRDEPELIIQWLPWDQITQKLSKKERTDVTVSTKILRQFPNGKPRLRFTKVARPSSNKTGGLFSPRNFKTVVHDLDVRLEGTLAHLVDVSEEVYDLLKR